MPLNRRHFLKLASLGYFSASFSLLGCTHKKFFNPDEDIILSGGSYADGNTTQHALIVINLTVQEKRVIKTPFMPHQILIDPNNKYRVYCFEKNGANACEVDLQKKSVRRNFQSTAGKFFSGHASFSQNGKQLYCIENNINDDSDKQFGNVIIRDTETFKTTKMWLTQGLSAHDCQLTDKQTFVVSHTGLSNSNQQTSLNYIVLETGQVIKRLYTSSDVIPNKLNNGHFEIDEENNLVIASAPLVSQKDSQKNHLLGGVSIKKHNGQLITMKQPEIVIKRMTGEALSIEISQQKKVAAVTHPDANLLTFWSIDKNQIIKAFGIEKPRGICQTLNGENFIVSYGNKAAMAKISINDLTPVSNSIVQPTHASGEHIINWSKTLRKIMPKNLY
ncbi:hypothetical protein MNBD_GAMMA06-2231 [hydrothermal vent metagenome]|uniref:DUF1513 domain-containing protein n=1 Tax=hydrothermal vent metagenome TaxID=652676 RepID=A0A3B0WZ97_9ZZZZ